MTEVISQTRQGKPRLPTPQHLKGLWSLQSSCRCGAREPGTAQDGLKHRITEQMVCGEQMSKEEEALDSFFHGSKFLENVAPSNWGKSAQSPRSCDPFKVRLVSTSSTYKSYMSVIKKHP